MFRCYFVKNGRIALGKDLAAETIDQAVAQGQSLLRQRQAAKCFDGIEVWCDTTLLYSDKRHAAETGVSAPVDSPFQTADTTMVLAWRPSYAPLHAAPQHPQTASSAPRPKA